MPQTSLAVVLDYLRKTFASKELEPLADGALLQRFLTDRDEAAFAVLVQRHGPMVLGVCRRVLGDGPNTEDAFQATFLVLLRRAAAVRRESPLSGWLYGVARRVALKARAKQTAQRNRQREITDMPQAQPSDDLTWQELRPVLDEEIGLLPEKCRLPLVLCYFEGKSYEQAAQELGWPKSSLASRLAKGRELLRERLVRRGITVSAAALTAALAEKSAAAPVAALLTINIVKAAALVAAGKAVVEGVLSAQVIALAEEAMTFTLGIKGKLVGMLLVLGLAGGVGLAGQGAWVEQAPAQAEKGQPPPLERPHAPVAQGEPAKDRTPPGPVRDRHGDPLPEGAVARLGTLRFNHGSAVAAMAFSPDGTLLASLDGADTKSDVIYILDSITGKVVHRVAVNADVLFSDARALAFSADGRTLVTGASVIDVAKGIKGLRALWSKEGIAVDSVPGWVAACSPDGKVVAKHQFAGAGTGIILINATDVKLISGKQQPKGAKELRRIDWDERKVGPEVLFRDDPRLARPAFSPDGVLLAAAGRDRKEICLWEVQTGKERWRLQGHGTVVAHFAFSRDGRLLASSGRGEGVIRLWSPQTGQLLHKLPLEAPEIGLLFLPDGKLLAGDVAKDAVYLYDPTTGKELRRWRMPCACLAVSPEGKVIASAGRPGDPIVHRWDLTTGSGIEDSSRGQAGAVKSLRFAPDSKSLFSIDTERVAREWDLLTHRDRGMSFGGPLGSLTGSTLYARYVKLSPDGRRAAVIWPNGSQREVLVCDTASGKDVLILRDEDRVGYPEFSPDGKTLAVGSKGGARLWDVATGKPLQHPPLPEGFLYAWSGDGKRLAILSSGKNMRLIQLCEVATGREIRRFELNGGGVGAAGIAYSLDGRSLACFSAAELIVFDTESGKGCRFPDVKAEGIAIGRVELSPSGGRLAAAVGNAIQIWEVFSGQRIREFQAEHRVDAMRFSPDGRFLASGGGDATMLLWDLTGGARAGQGKPAALSAAELDALWSDLSAHADKADGAIWSLALAPKQGVPLVAERLRLVAAEADEKEMLRVLRAVEALEYAGTPEARQALEATSKGTPNPRLARAAAAAAQRLAQRP